MASWSIFHSVSWSFREFIEITSVTLASLGELRFLPVFTAEKLEQRTTRALVEGRATVQQQG